MTMVLVEKIKRYLSEADDMTIATLRDDGYPQATTVSYVSDGLTIYFGCDPKSQKAKNIARSDKVSITVNLPYGEWNEIRGLSMGAVAKRITDPGEMQKMGALMIEKFPQVVELLPADPNDMALFRVTPKVVSILDYKKGFGHVDEVTL